MSSYDHAEKNQLPEALDLRVPSRSDARYSVTIVDDKLYARLGAQPMRPAVEVNKPQEMDSAIVCLALDRNADGAIKLRFRWQFRARLLDSEPPALFEGAPVVRDGRLLVARTRFEGRRAISSMECYDADAPNGRDEPPPIRWKQDLWAAEGATDPVRHRHDLLTLAGPWRWMRQPDGGPGPIAIPSALRGQRMDCCRATWLPACLRTAAFMPLPLTATESSAWTR